MHSLLGMVFTFPLSVITHVQGFFSLATGVQFPDAHVISVDCFAKGYLDQEKQAGAYIGLKRRVSVDHCTCKTDLRWLAAIVHHTNLFRVFVIEEGC